MKVFPAPGLKVRDPVTKQHIPAEGIEVDDNDIFWDRCRRDGDVVLTAPKQKIDAPSVVLDTATKKGDLA